MLQKIAFGLSLLFFFLMAIFIWALPQSAFRHAHPIPPANLHLMEKVFGK